MVVVERSYFGLQLEFELGRIVVEQFVPLELMFVARSYSGLQMELELDHTVAVALLAPQF